MGIIDNDAANPSALTDVVYAVPDYYIPRVLSELQQERKDAKGRVQYQAHLVENRAAWQEKMQRQAENRRKRRSE
ncbi:hypothetical protein [Rhodococcus sp. B10]|uniref:hypothetical protein n=1 Tax=Rhodococcus sp. B10 TaxID=2695876 RepID=UPI00142F9940|nr:hypothetical protein [Rhodococcus sp. B10]NIL77145.1 hypothetical protein [Rhodococcus sp. B10]